jgi:molybdopterin molybdotransferase
MIDLAEALRLVALEARPLQPRRELLGLSFGRVLAEAVVSDIDSPAWDRSMMDGFAVRNDDLQRVTDGPVELTVVLDLAAGMTSQDVVRPGTAARIMTGAAIPAGAEAVVPVERAIDGTSSAGVGGRVRLHDPAFRPGQHIARQATAFAAGDAVLPKGIRLTAAEIGLAAEAGATHVVASPKSRMAILTTGTELVDAAAIPAYGQTRNSNGPMLAAAAALLGAEPIPLGIAADRPEAIRAAIQQGLAADLLVLSGGVSAGDFDLVPGILQACGVRQVFHKVRLKPGKPVWFGKLDRRDGASTLVFGLPGNPASALVCFELFVRPALSILSGLPESAWHLPRSRAVLTAGCRGTADRPVFLPCRLSKRNGQLEAEPLRWTGSSDLRGLAGASGLLQIPEGAACERGDSVDVLIRTSPDLV